VPKFLITSAIPYVNGIKHLGNLVGSLLPADVHARFRPQLRDQVHFICGTDEHGTPTELAAAAADLPIGEFCLREHFGKQAFIAGSGFRSITSADPRHRRITRSHNISIGVSTPQDSSKSGESNRYGRRATADFCRIAMFSASARIAVPQMLAVTSATRAADCSIHPILSSRTRPSRAIRRLNCAGAATSSCANLSWLHGYRPG
jgi:hypothetical protein